MRARIFQPPKNAMQSGWANTRKWVLVHPPKSPRRADPLMGWIGGDGAEAQVRLTFASREEAEAYAKAHDIPYDLELPKPRRIPPKVYSDNFRSGRKENWTH